MADNVASISRHAFDKMRYHFRKKEQWEIRSEWDLKLFAKLSKRMTYRHIKYTVPLCDWSLALCSAEMFEERYNKNFHNNFVFNNHYSVNMNLVKLSLLESSFAADKVMDILES